MLLPTAIQMVMVAFRTGHYVSTLAGKLEAVDGATQSWTYVVPDASEATATSSLKSFHESRVSRIRCAQLPKANLR